MSFEVEIFASTIAHKDGIVEVSTGFLEEYFAVSRKTLSEWEKKGCPKRGHGKWDFIAVLKWRGSLHENDTTNWNLEKTKADTILKQRQADLAELELLQRREELINVEEIKQIIGDIIVDAKTLLLSVPPKVAPRLLAMNTLEDLEKVIVSKREMIANAKTSEEVESFAKEIVNLLYRAESVVEIDSVVKDIIYEALNELSEMGVGGKYDETRDNASEESISSI